MSGLVRLLIAGIVYSCVATVMAAGLGVGYAWSTGKLDAQKTYKILAVVHDRYFIQGSVRTPGVYNLETRPSLLELISVAGGLGPTYGATGFIMHKIQQPQIEAPPNEQSGPQPEYQLRQANIYKQAMKKRACAGSSAFAAWEASKYYDLRTCYPREEMKSLSFREALFFMQLSPLFGPQASGRSGGVH
jgi:hypothetical protein